MSDDFEEDISAFAPDPQLSLFVNLDGFEGPIDLLCLWQRTKWILGKISFFLWQSNIFCILKPPETLT